MEVLAAGLALSSLAAFAPQDADFDRDGLSDFAEVHKHFTDPRKADSDGDGVPDGEWDERREYAYTVRAVMHVMAPFDVASMTDDYQDVRVLERRDDLLEFEVVVYPFNTVAEAIVPAERWRKQPAALKPFLAPGKCADWDEPMRKQLLRELDDAGVDLDELDDAEAAVAVAKHLMDRSAFEDSFTTFAVEFVDGEPRVSERQRGNVAETLERFGRTLEQQWDRELFGRGMFRNEVHGSCTSSAIYLTTGLRAAGIPTRTVLCTPIVDANDAREVAWIGARITHHGIRDVLRKAAAAQEGSWTSHTFNEVFVGGRWRRLNYTRLGQDVLDPGGLGLMVHVHTFGDHSEAGLVGWGNRAAHPQHAALFGGPNPYSCVSLSDRFGAHADVANELLGPRELEITAVYAYDDPRRTIDTRLDDDQGTAHYLVVEFDRGEASGSEALEFWRDLPKDWVLRAPGRPDVLARGIQKFWGNEAVFLLRVDPSDFGRMPEGVAHELAWLGPDEGRRWKVRAGTRFVRGER